MKPATDQLDAKLLSFVWRFSRKDQILILLATVAGFPLLYLSLELPKSIINDAIQGRSFPRDVFGHQLGQIEYLMLLCVLFLATVIGINVMKWFTNVGAGLTGERMLRRLRFTLFEQTLRFPPRRLADSRPAEVVQAILGEIEPLGGFAGEIVATPVSQGGMLLVFVGFIFVQDPLLGVAATAMLPVQALVIPWLQRLVVTLNRERARNTRKLADSLASALGGIDEIRVHGIHRWHLVRVSDRLYANTAIRKALFVRKFTIKFINNLLNHLTPFLFYAIGGAMVISGRLDLGSLVAVIAAFKDLGKPWRELLTFYQRWSDFRGRFAFVVEHFSGADLAPRARLHAPPHPQLSGALHLEAVEAEQHGQTLHVPRLDVPPGATVAVQGGDPGVRHLLLRVVSGMEVPRAGRVSLGGIDLAEAPPASIGAAVGFLGPDPTILDASIAANLDYGLLRAAPPLPPARDGGAMRREAVRTGAPLLDPAGDWVDYAAAGCADTAALRARMVMLADAGGLSPDLIIAALAAPLAQAEAHGGRAALARARAEVEPALAREGLSDIVEPWDRSRLAENATLIENLLFALPAAPGQDIVALLDKADVLRVLRSTGAEALMADIGADLARAFAGLAETVKPDSPLLDRVGSFGRADVLGAAALAPRLPGAGRSVRDIAQRRQLVALAARFTPVRDRFDVFGPDRRGEAMAIRAVLARQLGSMKGLVPLDAAELPPSVSVAESLLAGRRREDRRAGWRRLEAALIEAITSAGLRDMLIAMGLDQPIGAGGSLNPVLRQRVALVRSALKRPRVVVLEGNGPATDAAARRFLRTVLPDVIMFHALDDSTAVAEADIVARLDADGVLAAEGRPSLGGQE